MDNKLIESYISNDKLSCEEERNEEKEEEEENVERMCHPRTNRPSPEGIVDEEREKEGNSSFYKVSLIGFASGVLFSFIAYKSLK